MITPAAHADARHSDCQRACDLLGARPDPTAAFSVVDMADLVEVTRSRAYELIRHLIATGKAEVAVQGKGARPGLWHLCDKPPPDHMAKPQTATDQMWAAMRAMPSFSPTSLAAHADVGRAEVTVEAARRYCRALLAAGYLRVVQRADRGHEAVYRLHQRSGLKAPKLRQVLAVVDENLGTQVVVGGSK